MYEYIYLFSFLVELKVNPSQNMFVVYFIVGANPMAESSFNNI